MHCPFPGMDPYLEGDLWTTFHSQMAAEIARQLSPKLAPNYVALTEKRYILDTAEDTEIAIESPYPDVGILETGRRGTHGQGTLLRTAPLEMATVMPEQVPYFWVEIRDTKKRRLVTLIEMLSPANKRGEGREQYLDKRAKVLQSSAHLLEIDLLRRGRRVPMRERLPAAPYFVFLSRASRRPITQIWLIALDEPLPPVPVPLLEGDEDVILDLQLAFTTVYNICRYDLIVNYREPPEVPVPRAAKAWLAKILKKAAVR